MMRARFSHEPNAVMANEIEQLLADPLGKITSRLQELVREAVKDELTGLHNEVRELRSRLAVLEQERAQNASDSLQQSF
jgi:PleD family two-component response regulator